MSDRRILYVDDEHASRVVFAHAFQRKFPVVCVENGQLALEVLAKGDIAVLVTDQRMPGMTGHELLERARALYPHIIRIIITAYSEIDPILRAVNDGLVSRYVVKPWDRVELEHILAWALGEAAARADQATLALQLFQRERLSTLREAQANRAAWQPIAPATLTDKSDVGEAVRAATGLCGLANPAMRGRWSYTAAADLPSVKLDFAALVHLFVNLLENAMWATSNGGRIAVEASVEGSSVRFSITDGGVGMTPEALDNCGKPFFTTRAQHAGLGLAQCREIVHSAGSQLTCERGAPSGTTVRFTLPIAPTG